MNVAAHIWGQKVELQGQQHLSKLHRHLHVFVSVLICTGLCVARTRVLCVYVSLITYSTVTLHNNCAVIDLQKTQ